jgi:hypothetical protein
MTVFVALLFGLAPMASAFGPQGIGANMTDQEMDKVRGGAGFLMDINLQCVVDSLDSVTSGDIAIEGLSNFDAPREGAGFDLNGLGITTICGSFTDFNGIAMVVQAQGSNICILNYFKINLMVFNEGSGSINAMLNLL